MTKRYFTITSALLIFIFIFSACQKSDTTAVQNSAVIEMPQSEVQADQKPSAAPNAKISYYKNKMVWCGPGLPYKARAFTISKSKRRDGIATIRVKLSTMNVDGMGGPFENILISFSAANSPKALWQSLHHEPGETSVSFIIGGVRDGHFVSSASVSDADGTTILSALKNNSEFTMKLYFIDVEPNGVGTPTEGTLACRLEVVGPQLPSPAGLPILPTPPTLKPVIR